MNQAGFDLLRSFEGFAKLIAPDLVEAYQDIVGVWTIAYGFTRGVKQGDRMTRVEADARLITEVAPFEAGLGVDGGTPNQLAAMTCLAYNIGLTHFLASTVRRLHDAGDFSGAANAFRMWNMAGGRVVPGLARRREAERLLYLTA